MSLLDQDFSPIEERYGFQLPLAYRDAWKRGWCRTENASYLCLPDMVWMPLSEIVEYQFQEYQLPGFVPFATTGGGDLWCFQPSVSGPDGPRVVECPHDCNNGWVYATDFRSAVYRQILESTCDCFYTQEELARHVAKLRDCAIVIDSILLPSERGFLRQILARSFDSSVLPALRPTEWHYLVPPRSDLIQQIRDLFPTEEFPWMMESHP